MFGPRLIVLCLVSGTLMGACRRAPVQTPEGEQAGSVDLVRLLSASNLARNLSARGGAQVQAQTSFQVAPAAASPEASTLRGEQNITTTAQIAVNAHGHYAVVEENNQDGGREVHFTGKHIAVKLRYAKRIKRDARAPEPQQILEQALGGPAAFWEIFGPAAATSLVPSQATGTRTLKITKGTLPPSSEPSAPVAPGASPLSAWRRTAVPSTLEGELRYLPATAKADAMLVSATLAGTFTARTAAGPITGQVKLSWAATSIGEAGEITIPDDAEDLRLGQRTILEERALLQGLPTGVPSR